MSFFAKLGSGSDSDSDSGSESEESILSGDEGEVQDLKLAQGKKGMFERGSDDEDDSDDDDDEDDDEDDSNSDGGRAVGLTQGRGWWIGITK